MAQDDIFRDKAETAVLIARYNAAIDDGDIQGWANCFAPEGVFEGMIGRFAAHRELDRFTAATRDAQACQIVLPPIGVLLAHLGRHNPPMDEPHVGAISIWSEGHLDGAGAGRDRLVLLPAKREDHA